jgi:hypothetical protein
MPTIVGCEKRVVNAIFINDENTWLKTMVNIGLTN